ncbi:glycoside hydrolase family 113 [Kitasatospora sp. HPMI-4]|uniref:glycoside hydrolase family 113 n=1 Tax=Kitasatospora sp. HPMI-4 TaxID=3448443 RepID=UPI003F1D803D
MTRSRRPWLAVLPVTVVTAVAAVPLALGSQPLHWAPGSAVPRLSTGATPSPVPSPVKEFADPVINAADPVTATPSADTPTVAHPWEPGMPQWGAQVYWEDMPSDGESEIRGKAQRIADYLVGLGANSVALSFPVYIDGIDSNSLHTGQKTPSPARLKPALDTFHKAGLRITLRPIIDERSLLPQWRGALAPADREKWFASYGGLLDRYADVAKDSSVTTMVAGTELVSLEGDPHWSALVSELRGHFPGELAYDTNWDNYVAHDVDVPVDQVQVDAYFPVDAPDSAGADQIAAAWNQWLDRKHSDDLSTTLLSEAGIGAENGAYRSPGDFYRYGRVNPQVQATWYTAVCQVVRERRLGGVYWWSVNFHTNPSIPPADDHSRLDFAGRPATEQAVKSCFSQSYRLPVGSQDTGAGTGHETGSGGKHPVRTPKH